MLGPLILSLALGGGGVDGAADDLVLLPDAVLGEDGKLHEGWSVVIRDGRIHSVGAAAEGAEGVRMAGVLAPGMIDAYSSFGADGRVSEESMQLTPGLRAADAFDPESKDLAELLERGVTTLHLVPAASNVFAGRGTLLATGGTSLMRAEQTVLLASMVPGLVRDTRVGPTSLAGAAEIFGQEYGALSDEERALTLWVAVAESEAVRYALDTSDKLGLAAPQLIAYGELGTYGGDLAGKLIVLPAQSSASARSAETWKRLHKSGTRFVLGSRDGDGGWGGLRTGAMALSRATGDPVAAWAAVTTNAAEVLGTADTMGKISAGAEADLVLWTAHPLDATARVEAVMIGGTTVWRRGVEENN